MTASSKPARVKDSFARCGACGTLSYVVAESTQPVVRKRAESRRHRRARTAAATTAAALGAVVVVVVPPPGAVVVVVPPLDVVVVVVPPPVVVVVVVLSGQIIGSVKSSVRSKRKSDPAKVSKRLTSSALVASESGNVTRVVHGPVRFDRDRVVATRPFPLGVSSPSPT